MGVMIERKKRLMMQQKKDENLIKINELIDKTVWWQGNAIAGYVNHCTTPKIPVIPEQSYFLLRNSNNQKYVCYFDQSQEYVEQVIWEDITAMPNGTTKQIPSNIYFVGITIGIDKKDTAVFKKV